MATKTSTFSPPTLGRRAFGRMATGGLILAALPPLAAARETGDSLLATVPQKRLVFDVRGLDRSIGRHEVVIEGEPAAFTVRSDVDIDVSILGLSLFTYRHSGVETWENDRLVAFASRSVGDERKERVVGEATPDGFAVEGRKGLIMAPADIMVGSFWTQRMMARDVLLDPQKGVLEEQIIRDREETTWPVDGKSRAVTRYRISSILNGEIAYDAAGRWVGAMFKKKSTEIEYRLRT